MNRDMRGKLADIRILVCDVDGTLTDGTVVFSADGNESKGFHVHDGLGISLAIRHGVEVVFMTGRSSNIVDRRASELGVTTVLQGISNKQQAVDRLFLEKRVTSDAVAYIGDDLNDLPAMARVGLVFAVNDASKQVCDRADIVLTKSGGRGAVREAIDLILDAKFGSPTVIEKYVQAACTTNTQLQQ